VQHFFGQHQKKTITCNYLMAMTLIASTTQADERACLNIFMYQEFENNLCLNIKEILMIKQKWLGNVI
jgi:hypothetical protein